MPAASDIARLLSERFPRRVNAGVPERVACARDLWQRHLIGVQEGAAIDASRLPAVVVSPETTADVVALVSLARREGLPLVPFGAGSGVCGGIACDARTIVVDTKRMHSARRLDAGPRLAVGPGAMGITLEEALAREGVTLGHFPSSILCSTVGGWVAARGAGQCSGRYGKIEDMVTGAECVLGTGEVVRLQRRASGLELLPLLVGSEGAFGIFTELELRLHRAPEERAFAAYAFPDMQRGIAALRRVYQAGLRPAVARLYDPLDSVLLADTSHASHARSLRDEGFGKTRSALLRALLRVPRLLELGIGTAEHTVMEKSKLVLVFEGARAEAHEDAEAAAHLAAGEGGESLGEGPARAWFERRYAVSYRQSPVFRAGVWNDTMEVAAPWSKLDAVYRNVRRALSGHALVMAHMSHAYPDGCSVYFTFLGASRGTGADDEHAAAWRDAIDATLDSGGILSHHHGIGRLRKEALVRELGEGGIEAHRALKRAWDPSGIMSPGSAFDPAPATGRADETRRPNERNGAALVVDEASGLVRLDGSSRVDDAERALRDRGLTLGLDAVPELSVNAWIAAGMQGSPDPYADPVEQRLAGLRATLTSGALVDVRPGPRRATGPDLGALFVGAEERVGHVDQAWLRARALGAAGARPFAYSGERSPPLEADEKGAFEALVTAFR